MTNSNKGGGNMRRRAFALLAVMLMLATAFAGVSFIAFNDDDSSAYAPSGSGTKSDPYTSIDMEADSVDQYFRNNNKYVRAGTVFNIIEHDDGEIDYWVSSVTSGHGLTANTNTGVLSGTLSGTGTVTMVVSQTDGWGEPGTASYTFTIVAAVTNYTVTISAGTGGSVSKSSVSVPSGTSISTSGNTLTIGSNTITATANSGYSFSSWSNASGTVTANRTITANFASNGYTVTFNGNGGTPGSSSLTGTSITLPSATKSSTTGSTYGSTSTYTYYSVTTYTFDGWYTSSSGGTYKGGAGSTYTPTSNTTLYAHWKSNSTTVYTYYYGIAYDANGGSGGPSSTDGGTSSSSSKNVTLSNSVPSRSGYTFLGWSTSSSATSATYAKGGTYSFSYGTTTLYAVWEQNKTTYYAKLVYNANGGSGAPSQQSTSGEYYSNPGSYGFTISSTAPTRSGKVFAGWSTSSTATSPSYYAGGTIYVSYSSSSSASTTLYAVWKDPTLTLYQVGQQYAVVGKTVSFSAICAADPSGTAVGYETSNVSSGLTVTTSGSTVTCSASSVGTYTFTLTAVATGYTSSSITVTVQFVPVLAFTNAPNIGVIGS